jgi:hypothetical protein
MVTRKLTRDDVDVQLECLPEDTQIEGNASCVDPETDAETVAWIRSELDRGNDWAWCTARVTVTWNGLEGVDYLSCCSYRNERDFRNDGYYDDMIHEALADLNRKVAAMAHKLESLVVGGE